MENWFWPQYLAAAWLRVFDEVIKSARDREKTSVEVTATIFVALFICACSIATLHVGGFW